MNRKEASDPTASPEELHKNVTLYPREVAGNPNTPPQTLEELSHGRHYSYKQAKSVAKAILENPILPVICLEDPGRGMEITAGASWRLSESAIAEILFSSSRKDPVRFSLLCIERVAPLWKRKYPAEKLIEFLSVAKIWLMVNTRAQEEEQAQLLERKSSTLLNRTTRVGPEGWVKDALEALPQVVYLSTGANPILSHQAADRSLWIAQHCVYAEAAEHMDQNPREGTAFSAAACRAQLEELRKILDKKES